MFGIGIGEFILIMVVALLVIGPDKLPEIAKSIAKAYNELRRTGNEFKRTVTSVADIDVIGIAEGKLGGERKGRGRAGRGDEKPSAPQAGTGDGAASEGPPEEGGAGKTGKTARSSKARGKTGGDNGGQAG